MQQQQPGRQPQLSWDGLTISSSEQLVAVALKLGADRLGPLTPDEIAIARKSRDVSISLKIVRDARDAIGAGEDPLGEVYCRIRSADERRPMGATYTPSEIVEAMTSWSADNGRPERVIDPGAGSGRFAIAAGRRFPRSEIVAVELDALSALLSRAHLVAAGLERRSHVVVSDYRELELDPIKGATLFLGNPPYVRHHQIGPVWKQWLTETALERGLQASQLAGLHVHFFLATAELGRAGDYGTFITSAEWLDVNYGSLVRELLLDGLSGTSIHRLDPTLTPFEKTATTGAITCFRVGEGSKSMRLREVKTIEDVAPLVGGRAVSKQRLAEATRWTPLFRSTPKLPEGYVELGEICRVHRGAVTGANHIWITNRCDDRLPASVLTPSVTRARELFVAETSLSSPEHLRRVIDLPQDLDALEAVDRKRVDAFLKKAKQHGAADGYVAKNRRVWWSVGLRAPAPILATYMARRPPAFVRNLASARHINIAHGLYPRIELSSLILDRLAAELRTSITQAQGRTYAGGLTKFEPKEMERLPVPSPEVLAS